MPDQEELEIKLAYLEQSYNQLNEVVVQLQRESMQSKEHIAFLLDYIKHSSELGLVKASDETPPPHY